MKKTVHVSGTRKRAIARATLREGNGIVRVNNIILDDFEPTIARMRIREPIIIADKVCEKIDISVRTHGGGYMAQAGAARLAIARALVLYTKSDSLKATFLKYDRQLLVADVRRKEMCKPNDSKARAKRQKSYR